MREIKRSTAADELDAAIRSATIERDEARADYALAESEYHASPSAGFPVAAARLLADAQAYLAVLLAEGAQEVKAMILRLEAAHTATLSAYGRQADILKKEQRAAFREDKNESEAELNHYRLRLSGLRERAVAGRRLAIDYRRRHDDLLEDALAAEAEELLAKEEATPPSKRVPRPPKPKSAKG